MAETENRNFIIFGTTAVFVLMVLCGSAIIVAWRIDRTAGQFPGAEHVSDHAKYKLPKLYRWDDTYATDATIADVYQWYSITFELGPEKQANGSCSLLEDLKDYYVFDRYTGVYICDMGDQRMMFVTRATTLFP